MVFPFTMFRFLFIPTDKAEIINVTVNVGLTSLSATLSLEEANSTVDVTCHVDANPAASIEFVKDSDEQVAETTGYVMGHHISRSCQNNGLYVFEAWNKLNAIKARSQPIRLNIYCKYP